MGGLLLAASALFGLGPSLAAGGLLHPTRTALYRPRPNECIERNFAGDGVTLRGWNCASAGRRRGTVVYLHGVADNRSSAVGVIDHLLPFGFDVVAYDSRAHGLSDGAVCTYGFFEKHDLTRVIDALPAGPVVLIGSSLGGAVALQAAVGNPRVVGVVAAEAFSDLRTIAVERAPRVLVWPLLRRAFELAEVRGQFDVASVSPVAAAASLHIPVLLIHGADDVETRPAHSTRILSALAGPKQLVLIARTGHNQSLSRTEASSAISRWLSAVLPGEAL